EAGEMTEQTEITERTENFLMAIFRLFRSFRLFRNLSSCKRFPALSPIIILRPGEVLLVIVNGRLTVSVAGIVILAAKLARVPDRFEHRKNAQAAFRF